MAEQTDRSGAGVRSAEPGSAHRPAPAGSSADHRSPAATVEATIRYFAAARAAAGTAQEQTIVLGEPTIAQVLADAVSRHGPELARVFLRCSYLLDGVAVHSTAGVVSDGQVLDVLPPFAGG